MLKKTRKIRSKDQWISIFLSRIDKTSKCWIWKGAITSNGYGISGFVDEKGITKNQRAHRISWQIFKGAIPKDLFVLHKCDVRNCVRPYHLWLGTYSDNMRDCTLKNRANKGLTPKDVKYIRKHLTIGNKWYPGNMRELAKRFDVHKATIVNVYKRISWRHIK